MPAFLLNKENPFECKTPPELPQNPGKFFEKERGLKKENFRGSFNNTCHADLLKPLF